MALWVLALVTTAYPTGIAMVGPVAGRVRHLTAAATVPAALTQLMLAGAGGATWGALVVAASAATLALPALLRRTRPVTAAAAGALILAALALYGSPRPATAAITVALALTGAFCVGATADLARLKRWAAGSAALCVASGAGLAVTVATTPTTAVPQTGVPVLGAVTLGGHRLPVFVTPGRPGWNLVHVGTDQAAAGTDAARLTAATALPGAEHVWAPVWLAPGPNSVLISHAGATSAVRVEAGSGASGPDLRGPDGPECASFALGRALAGAHSALRSCPADDLDPADAASLRAVMQFVAARGARSVGLVDDQSPRGRQAAATVRAAAERAGLDVEAPGANRNPLIVVSGWDAAATAVADVNAGRLPAQGTYLAPWLLTAPLLRAPAGQLIPLRFDPGELAPLRYLSALKAAFPGEPATAAGYAGWSGSRPSGDAAPARLYAASLVYVPGSPPLSARDNAQAAGHGAHGATRWLPDGAVIPVSGPLDDAA
jgi:hypothetical protein